MKTLGEKIIVRRGESFTLTREVLTNDGKPFVLKKLPTDTNQVLKQYLLITVTSTSYRSQGIYRLNKWLDLSKYPSFNNTYVYPIPLTDEQYTQNEIPGSYGADDWVYSYELNGITSYFYWDSTTRTYKPYRFIFSTEFLHQTTREWIESQYQYSFQIVVGRPVVPILTQLWLDTYPTRNPLSVPTDARTLWEDINKCNPKALKGIRYNAPICNLSLVDVLQSPEPLIIKSNF